MGDYYPKSIQIGGVLKKKDVKKFISGIKTAYLETDWAQSPDHPGIQNLDALRKAVNNAGHLVLMNDQAGHRFEDFVELCTELKLSFDVHRDPLYDCNADGESVRWTKGQRKPFVFHYACDEGFVDRLIASFHIESAIDLLTAGRPDMALAKLRECCPVIPPLPKFEVK